MQTSLPCPNRRQLLRSPSSLSTTPIIFAMLFLLFMYFLTQSNVGGDASPIPLVERRADSCNDLNQCRTIWSIIWSCLSTIFLCTWVTLRPNIVIAPDTRGPKAKLWHPLRRFLINKLWLFLCALVIPEGVLAWASWEYVQAERIKQECKSRQKSTDENPAPVRKWKQAHGFFIIMGGFHLYGLPDGAASIPYPPEMSMPSEFVLPLCHSREHRKANHPLRFKDLSAHALAYLAPTEEEIKDKGKADIIAKILVILQTSWFVAQCIARGVEHLPLAELEVVTLAYATMNMFIYCFWWDKPKDVECPVRVYKASNADIGGESGKGKGEGTGVEGIFRGIIQYITRQDRYSRLSHVPMLRSGKPGDLTENRLILGISILGVAFGAIHWVAWNFEFPSHAELLLWRISCVAIIAVPLSSTIACIVVMALKVDSFPLILTRLFLPLTALLYMYARIATLVMAFTTLQALPPDAFKTVDWTTFIPHL